MDKTCVNWPKGDSARKQIMKDFLGSPEKISLKTQPRMDGSNHQSSRFARTHDFLLALVTLPAAPLSPTSHQKLNNTIRDNALDPFRDLLLSVSREPAMLQFLNNQQNRKDHSQ